MEHICRLIDVVNIIPYAADGLTGALDIVIGECALFQCQVRVCPYRYQFQNFLIGQRSFDHRREFADVGRIFQRADVFCLFKETFQYLSLAFRTHGIAVDLTDTGITYCLRSIQMYHAAFPQRFAFQQVRVDLVAFFLCYLQVDAAHGINDICQRVKVYCRIVCDIQIEVFVDGLDGKFCAAVSISVVDFCFSITGYIHISITGNGNQFDFPCFPVDRSHHDGVGTTFVVMISGVQPKQCNIGNFSILRKTCRYGQFAFIQCGTVQSAQQICEYAISCQHQGNQYGHGNKQCLKKQSAQSVFSSSTQTCRLRLQNFYVLPPKKGIFSVPLVPEGIAQHFYIISPFSTKDNEKCFN